MPAGRMSLIRQVADVSDKIIKVQCVIPKSGHRFSDKITHKQKAERDDDSTKNHSALVFRFRRSHHCGAYSFANFGINGTLAIYDSSAVFGFEVPTRTRGYSDKELSNPPH